MIVEFGEWLPDLPILGNPGASVATNAIPQARGYVPFPQQQVYSDALTARAQGAIGVQDKDGAAHNFAGDATKLYTLTASNTTWVDASQTATTYGTAATEYWEMVKWKETVIATNFADNPQTITLGGANFSDLTTAVKGKHIAVVGDFVVLGNVDEAGTKTPFRIRWSAINDPTDWTVSAATQADFSDLPGRGAAIQAIASGDFGVIVQEESVYRMTYAGPPTIFQLDETLPGVGTLAPQSVRRFGRAVFMYAQDGFRAIIDGASAELIGANKVDKFFANDLTPDSIHRIFGVVDPINKRVFWAYPGNGSIGGSPNRLICYDIASQRWSLSEQATELLWLSVTGGQTIDSAIFQAGGLHGDLDSMTISLDSPVWASDSRILSGFDSTQKMTQFSGSAQDATLETGETQLFPGKRARPKTVRPLIDGGSAAVQVGRRSAQSAGVTWGDERTVRSTGVAAVRGDSRYHRVRVMTSGDFSNAVGVEFEAEPTGGR